MHITLLTYLIVCPMVFLAGFVDAIGGGGGLISLPAYLFAGIPPHMAVGTNKLSSATGTAVSTFRICKEGNFNKKIAIPSIIAAMLGSSIGANISLLINESLFKIILIFILPIVAFQVLKKKDLEPTETIPFNKQRNIVLISSFIIGCYDGIYGPGTGTFLILAYTALAKMNVLHAAGNTKLVNLTSNVTSLAIFFMNGTVLIPLGLCASIFSIAGHYTGSGMVLKNGSKLVRIIILCVITLLFVKIVLDFTGIMS